MFLLNFLRSQLFVTPPYPTQDLSGKTVIVTGSNTGLGLEAARHFARLNCTKLIIAVRNVAKGQAAKESILTSERRTEDTIEVWELDISSNASVKAFAERAKSLDRLDAVVENAGVMNSSFKLAEGHEQVIKVNVIGTFLLALLLLPKLRETAQKHTIETNLAIVSSEVHHLATIPEEKDQDLFTILNDDKAVYDGQARYSISKALEVLFVRELVKHTQQTPIINLVNPGLCWSEFQRDMTGRIEQILRSMFLHLLARTTEVGSRTLVAGACAGRESHGEYMADSANQEVADWVKSPSGMETQKRVYGQILAELESIEPGISRNI